MPTILRRAGVETPAGVQGGDLFEGTDTVFAEESHEGNVLQSLRTRRGTTELKLITANEGNPRGLAPAELYRVDLDRREMMNLVGKEPDLQNVASARLAQTQTQAQVGRVQATEVSGEADRARLEALGYAGGADETPPAPPPPAPPRSETP